MRRLISDVGTDFFGAASDRLPFGFVGLPPVFACDAALGALSPVGREAGRLLFADGLSPEDE